MSLAILGLFKAFAPLFPTNTRRFAPAGSMGLTATSLQPGIPMSNTARHAQSTRPRVASMPLRVTRLLDQGCPSASAGRMVMSGSFADVCAELDRLVALESAREGTRTRH
jgi:hypothetical protein